MLAELKHTLRRKRGQLIGWAIGLALYALMMVSFFDSIVGIEGIQEMMQAYPEDLAAFFGGFGAMNTPKGYLEIYYFNYMPVIIGIFTVGVGAGLLVSDEEKGTLDLILSYPVSRTALFWGRVLGLLALNALVLLIAYLSWVLPAQGTGMDLTWIQILRPFLPLFVQLVFFGALALLLSLVLPSVRSAGMLTGGILVGNYLLIGLSNLNEDLRAFIEYTPLHYYQGADAVDGLDWIWLGGIAGVSLVLVLLAWWRFQGRDIRVAGEGSWHLPALSRLLRRDKPPLEA